MIGGNWDEVKAIDENARRRLPPGGYVVRIVNVYDVRAKEYLEIEYDIAEGDYTGYYNDLKSRFKFWGGKFIRSYKDKARPFFKGFIEAVEQSNNVKLISERGIDETQLVGLLVGVVLGEEQYIGNDGSLKTRLKVAKVTTTDHIRKGEFIVPPLKTMESVKVPETSEVIDTTVDVPTPDSFEALEEELPF